VLCASPRPGVLLRFGDNWHWLRVAARLLGHLFLWLPGQSEYNTQLKAIAPLMDATPIRSAAVCGLLLVEGFGHPYLEKPPHQRLRERLVDREVQ